MQHFQLVCVRIQCTTFQSMYLYTKNMYLYTAHQTTPLHLAAHHGQLHTVQHLVTAGADLNIKDDDGVSE